jgi:type IV secretion system protein VirB1
MTPANVLAIAMACSPNVAPSTIQNIVSVESRGNELAIGVNGDRLERQPGSYAEAVNWTRWLVAHGFNIDAGIMQLNVRNWARFGITPENVFDACRNMNAGGQVLTENYMRASKQYGPGQQALRAAISAYNTGNFQDGFSNGYVRKVATAAGLTDVATEVPPLRSLRDHRE